MPSFHLIHTLYLDQHVSELGHTFEEDIKIATWKKDGAVY
jgi:hypothetical protein